MLASGGAHGTMSISRRCRYGCHDFLLGTTTKRAEALHLGTPCSTAAMAVDVCSEFFIKANIWLWVTDGGNSRADGGVTDGGGIADGGDATLISGMGLSGSDEATATTGSCAT